MFDYPSVRAVTDYLTAQMLKSQAASAQGTAPSEALESSTDMSEDGEAALPAVREPLGAAWASHQRPLAVLAAVVQPMMAQPLLPAARQVRAEGN